MSCFLQIFNIQINFLDIAGQSQRVQQVPYGRRKIKRRKKTILKPVAVGDPTSKGSFALERLRLGLNVNVILLLGFNIALFYSTLSIM